MENQSTGRKKKRSPFRTLCLTALLLASAAVILNQTVFRLRYVRIVGNRTVSPGTVAALAGLDGKRGFFGLNEDEIRSGIEKDPCLVFVSLEKSFPNAVTLTVRERQPAAFVTVLSQSYVLDEEGYVLRKLNRGESGLIRLTGMNVRDIREGERISSVNQQQVNAYCAVMGELKNQGADTLFTELNVSDPGGIYIISGDGFLITLGDAEEMRAKLLTVRGVLHYAESCSLPAGGLDASVAGNATYTPPEE